jgi:hypothetical protein
LENGQWKIVHSGDPKRELSLLDIIPNLGEFNSVILSIFQMLISANGTSANDPQWAARVFPYPRVMMKRIANIDTIAVTLQRTCTRPSLLQLE